MAFLTKFVCNKDKDKIRKIPGYSNLLDLNSNAFSQMLKLYVPYMRTAPFPISNSNPKLLNVHSFFF